MKTTHIRLGMALAALAGLSFSTLLTADEPATSRKTTATGQEGTLDQHFAACLIVGNQNEIAAAKIAEQRSKSPEVKEFAQMMAKDHQKFITDLEKYAGNQAQRRRPSLDGARVDVRSEGPKTATAAGERPRTAADAGKPAIRGDERATVDALMQIKHEMADECLASMQRELSAKEGREFDACYIGMNLAAHMHMIDELKVLERHASGDLVATLRSGRETAQKHLDRAKEIMKDIEKGETKTAAK